MRVTRSVSPRRTTLARVASSRYVQEPRPLVTFKSLVLICRDRGACSILDSVLSVMVRHTETGIRRRPRKFAHTQTAVRERAVERGPGRRAPRRRPPRTGSRLRRA
jgi:hypothetical protein